MDYEKAYKEALKRAKGFKTDEYKDVAEYIFPELAENKGERIRKAITEFFKNYSENGTWKAIPDVTKWIAWLEAQGEQKPTDKVEPKFKVGDYIVSTISGIPYYITQVAYDHYLTDVGCIIMFNAQDNFELVEQKPAWTEEDEVILDDIICSVNASDALNGTISISLAKHEKKILWLKQLKDRIQPQTKYEWSDDDEKFVHGLIRGLSAKRDIHGHTTFSSDGIDITKTIDWLKSLRPQNKNISKEFKDTIRDVKTKIAQCNGFNRKHREEVFSLLDTLRPQNTWKLSDEQMDKK